MSKTTVSKTRFEKLLKEHGEMLALLEEIIPKQYGCFRVHTFITVPECPNCQLAERARQLINSAKKR